MGAPSRHFRHAGRQGQQHAQPTRQLGSQEADRGRHADRARRQRPHARALHLTIDLAVPQVVDRAASAAHDERAGAEGSAERQIRWQARRRRERHAPHARPKQEPRPNGTIPPAELCEWHGSRRQPAVHPRAHIDVCEGRVRCRGCRCRCGSAGRRTQGARAHEETGADGQSKRREGLLSTRSKVGVRIMSAKAASGEPNAAPRRRRVRTRGRKKVPSGAGSA